MGDFSGKNTNVVFRGKDTATKIGSYWAIPVDARKPKDDRVKSGKYIKRK